MIVAAGGNIRDDCGGLVSGGSLSHSQTCQVILYHLREAFKKLIETFHFQGPYPPILPLHILVQK